MTSGKGEIILYRTGRSVGRRYSFERRMPVNRHITSILDDGKLAGATISQHEIVQMAGSWPAFREVPVYNPRIFLKDRTPAAATINSELIVAREMRALVGGREERLLGDLERSEEEIERRREPTDREEGPWADTSEADLEQAVLETLGELGWEPLTFTDEWSP